MNPSFDQYGFYSPTYSHPYSSPSFTQSSYPLDYPSTPSPTDSESQLSESKRRRSKDRTSAVRQRKAANERERRRMYSINKGFDKLRDRLPNPMPIDKKLSKVDTLKTAIEYIHKLHSMIVDAPTVSHANPIDNSNPSITISNQNDPYTKLTISWQRRPTDYGNPYRDQTTGVIKASCSKVWIPGA